MSCRALHRDWRVQVFGMLHERPNWESVDLTSRVSDRHGQFTRHVSEF